MPQQSALLTTADLDALLDGFDWAAWERELRTAFAPAFEDIAVDQGTRTAAAQGIDFAPKDPFLQRYFTHYLGARITQLNDTTRALVTETLHRALEDGVGDSVTAVASKLIDAVGHSAAFSPARALLIARTETATAYNVGALGAYHQAGITEVEVSDGDGDDECAEADGAVWTLEEALANPLAHPNCTRAFAPHVSEDDTADEAA